MLTAATRSTRWRGGSSAAVFRSRGSSAQAWSPAASGRLRCHCRMGAAGSTEGEIGKTGENLWQKQIFEKIFNTLISVACLVEKIFGKTESPACVTQFNTLPFSFLSFLLLFFFLLFFFCLFFFFFFSFSFFPPYPSVSPLKERFSSPASSYPHSRR